MDKSVFFLLATIVLYRLVSLELCLPKYCLAFASGNHKNISVGTGITGILVFRWCKFYNPPTPPPSQQREVNLSNKSDQLPWKVLKYFSASSVAIQAYFWLGGSENILKKYSRGSNLDILSQLAGPGIITAKLYLMTLDGICIYSVMEDLSCTETPLCFTPQLNFYPMVSQSTPFWSVMVAIMFFIFIVPWLRSSSVRYRKLCQISLSFCFSISASKFFI